MPEQPQKALDQTKIDEKNKDKGKRKDRNCWSTKKNKKSNEFIEIYSEDLELDV